MIKHDIARLVAAAVEAAQRAGQIPEVPLPETLVERAARPELGDYASPAPLRLARAARQRPLDLARVIQAHLPPAPFLAKVEVAPPGFLNFTLADRWLVEQVETIRQAGPDFGRVDVGGGRSVQVEFVSANPTGPVHVGNGRGAVIGSALAAALAHAGFVVQKEYYVNDAGTQMETFYRTLWARYQQQFGREVAIPEGGYPGRYMVELAGAIVEQEGDRFLHLAEDQASREVGERGLARVVEWIRDDLAELGVQYDRWFRERSLYEGGQFDRAMGLLRERGYIVEREGAVWFTSSALGEDKDNVVIRSTGAPTYFASDIAYHYNKFLERGFDRVIDVWGADHQGHVPRMKAMVAALGVDPARLQVILYQLVTLKRGGEIVRISKRTGDIITLREVIEEVRRDACRFFFLSRSADSQMDFDLELAKEQSERNPVFYVQYAHARMAGIFREAATRGVGDWQAGDVGLLTHPAELALIRQMLRLPELVELVVLNLEPHHLPHYAVELATAFSLFYRDCRVLDPADVARSQARLKLVEAARAALANTLHLMGMSAPERM